MGHTHLDVEEQPFSPFIYSTDKSKISSNRYRIQLVQPIPPFIFREHSL